MSWHDREEEANVLFFIIVGIVAIFIICTFESCATLKEGFGGHIEPRPLVEQIIRMRPDYKGLTHRTCTEKNWVGECTKWDVVEYDLNDAAVRDRLIKFQFRCRIAGYRYKIHPDRASFVRYKREKACFFCKEETKLVNIVDVSQKQILLDGATVCWSEKTYPSGIQ